MAPTPNARINPIRSPAKPGQVIRPTCLEPLNLSVTQAAEKFDGRAGALMPRWQHVCRQCSAVRSRLCFEGRPATFYAEDSRASFPTALSLLLRFASAGVELRENELIRIAASGLAIALDDLAVLLGNRLRCRDRSPAEVFRMFAELHTPSAK